MRLLKLFTFYVIIFSLTPAVTNATSFLPNYLKDLEENGYCVIPNVLSREETELLYQRVWHEYIEKAWPNCKMEDSSNWKETFPIQNDRGLFGGSAGQIQVMWDLRQDSRIVNIFAQIWNTRELIVSMDGLSIMCPSEIREGNIEPWPHVDQAIGVADSSNRAAPPAGFISESHLKSKPFTIQGQFLFEDCCDKDGGFYCIPKSHLRFEEFALQFQTINTMLELSRLERIKMRSEYVRKFCEEKTDRSGSFYSIKQVTAPRGSLILWDSRTVHWNQHPTKDRPFTHPPKVRMVGYLCYLPKARLTQESIAIRKQAFETGLSTTHNAASPTAVCNQDMILPGFEKYLEDLSYIQPKVSLTPLGKSLLGIEQ